MTFVAQLHQAIALQNSGNLNGAMEIYARLVAKNQKNPDLLIRTAITALSLGDNKQAKTLARQVLKLHPEAGVARNVLGLAELNDRNLVQALSHLEKAVKLSPNDAQTRINLGEVLNLLNRPEQAVLHLGEAVRLAPDFAKARYALGVARKSVGDLAGAIESIRGALDQDPLHASAWKTLAYMGATSDDADIAPLNDAAERLSDQPMENAKIHFALFATYERAKKYEQAFEHLEKANRLIATTANHDVSTDEDQMRAIATVFSPSIFERFEKAGDQSQRPIFIVGMPRSGTTLVEQIFAGHSKVDACGELSALEDAIIKIGEKPNLHYPQVVERWKNNDVKGIGKVYLDDVKAYNITAPRFTDKMPENFLFLGVIRLAFPNACIIHCQRNPIDTCLANYRQMLTGHHPHIYDQQDLVRYYKAYEGLMEHWHAVMGDMIVDVTYEDMVAEPEAQAKRLLAFCDLAWEPQCMDVGNTERAVLTASAAQLKGGIHKNFVARWKHYEAHIKTIIDGLG